MNTPEAFLADILADPASDTTRLIFADWLEEYGEQPERAEFIRIQCELARREATPLDEPCRCTREVSLSEYRAGIYCWPCRRRLGPIKALHRREEELWYSPAKGFDGSLPGDWTYTIGAPDPDSTRPCAVVRRGFVAEIALSCADFMQHAASIFQAAPVEAVRLTDKKPYWNGIGYCWYAVDRSHPSMNVPPNAELPRKLYRVLTRGIPSIVASRFVHFNSEQAALSALAPACVELGREWARKAQPPAQPQEADSASATVTRL